MAFSFFTAFHTALQDPSSYFSFQKEMNLKAVEQVFFNSLAGTTVFDAVVLPEDLGSSATYDGQKSVRVRPLGIHDFIIPEPCSYKDPVKIKKILAMHPVAYPDSNSPLSAGNDTNPEHQAFGGGVVVECFFKDGPQSAGRLRGLTYRLKASRSTASKLDLNCLGISGGDGDHTKKDLFDNGLYKEIDLGEGFKKATEDISAFGAPIPCGEIIAFGRKENDVLAVLAKNPVPSAATDAKFWTLVLNHLSIAPTPNKIRLFFAWAAKESPSTLGPTNNPWATMWPGTGKKASIKFDPNITAFNWNTKNLNKYPQGYPWVKNYSTMEIGAKATAKTLLTGEEKYYKPILMKLREPSPDFPNSWFERSDVAKAFTAWGGASKGGDGLGYTEGVRDNYRDNVKPKFNINTNKLAGRAGACLKK